MKHFCPPIARISLKLSDTPRYTGVGYLYFTKIYSYSETNIYDLEHVPCMTATVDDYGTLPARYSHQGMSGIYVYTFQP